MDELNLSEIRTFADAERLLEFLSPNSKLKDPGWFVRQLERGIGIEREALSKHLGSEVVEKLAKDRYRSIDDIPYGVVLKLIDIWSVLQRELTDVIYHAEGLQRALQGFQGDWGSISEEIQTSITSGKEEAT